MQNNFFIDFFFIFIIFLKKVQTCDFFMWCIIRNKNYLYKNKSINYRRLVYYTCIPSTCKYTRFIQRNYLDNVGCWFYFTYMYFRAFCDYVYLGNLVDPCTPFKLDRCRYRNTLVLIGTVYAAFHVTVWPLYRSWVSSFFCYMESFLKISLLFHFSFIWFAFSLKIELIFKALRTIQNSFLLSNLNCIELKN